MYFNGSLCSGVVVCPFSVYFLFIFLIFKWIFSFFLFTFSYILWYFMVYKLTCPPKGTDLAYTFAQKISGHANRNAQFKKRKKFNRLK